MSSNSGKSFALPPARKPTTAEEFIAGAGKPPADAVAAATPVIPAKPSNGSRLPWEGEDDAMRRAGQPWRLTPKETAALTFVVENKPGARSRHDYLLKAGLRALQQDIKTLTGEDIEFAALSEGA